MSIGGGDRHSKPQKTRQVLLRVWQTHCSQKLAIADDLKVLGYYTLSASLIDFPELFPNKDKLPSYPIPVALIGKLAIYAIRIDPSNQIKQGYYIQKFGFIPF